MSNLCSNEKVKVLWEKELEHVSDKLCTVAESVLDKKTGVCAFHWNDMDCVVLSTQSGTREDTDAAAAKFHSEYVRRYGKPAIGQWRCNPEPKNPDRYYAIMGVFEPCQKTE